jgi:hypothetical protein
VLLTESRLPIDPSYGIPCGVLMTLPPLLPLPMLRLIIWRTLSAVPIQLLSLWSVAHSGEQLMYADIVRQAERE